VTKATVVRKVSNSVPNMSSAVIRSPRRIRFPRLGEDDDALGARARIGDAEHRDAALADPRNARDGFLDLLRIEMATRAYDDVLDTAGDVDVASCHVGAIPAVSSPTHRE